MTREYINYLMSFEWREKKIQLLRLYKNKCCNCETSERLEVHHMTYRNIYYEKNEDLRVLCKSCHNLWHLDALTKYEYRKIKKHGFKTKKRVKKNTANKNKDYYFKNAIKSDKQLHLRSKYKKRVKKIKSKNVYKLH